MNVRHTPKQTVVSSSDSTFRLTKRQVWGLGRVKEVVVGEKNILDDDMSFQKIQLFDFYRGQRAEFAIASVANCYLFGVDKKRGLLDAYDGDSVSPAYCTRQAKDPIEALLKVVSNIL